MSSTNWQKPYARHNANPESRTTMPYPLTLLSPARDIDVACAAIQAGADAIYIGAPKFGARQAAGNTLADIEAVVQYAHTYGVRVLVTLNTLLHDDEYPEAVEIIHALYHIGVDALIIQDLHLLRYNLPPIRLHASTQCDNRTAEQVIRLQQMGFKRVVLARELSLSEIRAIHDEVVAYATRTGEEPIELEVFVHGAVCVSYSGRCYISEVLTGRSANRGCCSQMCRMQYDLLDADGREICDNQGQPIHQQYLLSLQDMDRSAYLSELIDAGVTTFKIEGRLKDADYVTNVTAYYRKKLPKATDYKVDMAFEPNPEKTFHRGGTDYFLHGRIAHMANRLTPKSTGEYIGRVTDIMRNRLRIAVADGVQLHNGDGLCSGDTGFAINRIEGDIIYPNTMPAIATGAPLYRNQNPAFARTLRCERRIYVDVRLNETSDGFALELACDPPATYAQGKTEQWTIRCVFKADKVPAKQPERAMETIRTQLSKLGDTPYIVRKMHIAVAPYFIPIGELNRWRREAVEQLTLLRQEKMRPAPAAAIHPFAEEQPTDTASAPLMTCRYCLLYELGHCRKLNPMPVEPRYLRLRNNTLLSLTFDCRHCQMLIHKDTKL